MKKIDFNAIKESLTPEDIKRILLYYNVNPINETDEYILYPTVCHNISGGSNKLYYYKNTKLFHCYTECNKSFNIFTLLKKIHTLRNIQDSILIHFFDKIDNKYTNDKETYELEYLYYLSSQENIIINDTKISEDVLNNFEFNKDALSIWEKENISYDSMLKYDIKYDIVNNCIIIPIRNIDNDIVSIRGRYLDLNCKSKYKPIIYGNKILSYPSSNILYGLVYNKEAIKNFKKVIIFEGEKSVLKMDTIYGNKNISVATLGKNISKTQIKLLEELGVNEVIFAYDADYNTYSELEKVKKEYIKIAEKAKENFICSILIDFSNKLLYKDSPIDRGKFVFEEILKNRIYV